MTTAPVAPAWGVYGHEWAVEHLRQGIAHGRVRHGYLLVGAESVGKSRLAQAFAQALLCTDPDPAVRPCGVCSACRRVVSGNHADVLTAAEEDDTPTKIDTLRTLINQLALRPFEGGFRFGMIPRFEQIRGNAQDALLKTLEEPAPHTILLLMARSIEGVLPTIISRSQVLHLRPASTAAVRAALGAEMAARPPGHPVDDDTLNLVAQISGGRIGWAITALHEPDQLAKRAAALDLLVSLIQAPRVKRFALADELAKDQIKEKSKEPTAHLLALWQSFWRDAMLVSHGAEQAVANRDRLPVLLELGSAADPDALLAALRATNLLMARLHTNVNLRLALEAMLLAYPGLR